MTPQEIALVVAGIGLAGIVVGGLITAFYQKWQFNKTNKKESLVVVEGRLNEIEDWFDELWKICDELFHLAKKLVGLNIENERDEFLKTSDAFLENHDKVLDTLMHKDFLIGKIIDSKIEQEAFILVDSFILFLHIAYVVVTKKLDNLDEQQNSIELTNYYVHLETKYVMFIQELDEYKLTFYGIKLKKNNILHIFRRKQKELPKSKAVEKSG